MKIITCILLALLSFSIVKAQQKAKPAYPFADSLSNGVLRLPAIKLTYKGNSNHFDIYTAKPDNMYVIKPDNTVHFNMPTGNYGIIRIPISKPKEK
ncbi:hypothetical protein [Parafilimonas sp.]|uniref:hypothetical protein n=1 Tax=Parafilimonas sp. TaxID=1969739 RepID=UPI0039E33B9A